MAQVRYVPKPRREQTQQAPLRVSVYCGPPDQADCERVGRSLQMEEIFQKGFDVLVGFVRRRLLVVPARKTFFITSISCFPCLELRHCRLPQDGTAGS